jgi:hypothetical protein
MRKKTIQKYVEEAPEIPTNTCPYIDFIQEILKEARDETTSTFVDQKLILADSMLEYVRQSNESLRQSSHYWYNKFKYMYKK